MSFILQGKTRFVLFVLIVSTLFCGLFLFWPEKEGLLNSPDRMPEKTASKGGKSFRTGKGEAKSPSNELDVTTFQPSKDFVPRIVPWRPMSSDMKLRPDVGDGLQLDSDQVLKLEAVLNSLAEEAGIIQEEDAYISTDGKGQQIIFLAPIPEKWRDLREKFTMELIDAIGKPKTDYLIANSFVELGIITGNFGNIPRVIELIDHSALRKEFPNNRSYKDWTAHIVSGVSAEQSYAEYFPESVQRLFNAKFDGDKIMPEGHIHFNEPPPFLRPLIQVADK